jgi:hypothetical protein
VLSQRGLGANNAASTHRNKHNKCDSVDTVDTVNNSIVAGSPRLGGV